MPSDAAGPRIVAEGLTLALPGSRDPLPVLAGVDLDVAAGELVSIVGPSGCGKTALLSCLAGLREPDGGRVLIDGAPARPGALALMPQSDVLLPWRTVAENVAWAAELAGIPAPQAAADAAAMARRVGLGGFEDHFPHALSGGMRQRAALARTLTGAARGWLLDEPFGALDAITRSGLHEMLTRLRDEHAPTVVMVTHDLDEALDLADRIIVLSDRPARVLSEAAVTVPASRRRAPEWAGERAAERARLLSALTAGPVIA